MLRLVEHSLTGETYALVLEHDSEGPYCLGAWPVPRTVVMCADGSLWGNWDVDAWARAPDPMGAAEIAAWSDTQPWKTLAEV